MFDTDIQISINDLLNSTKYNLDQGVSTRDLRTFLSIAF